MGLIEINGVDIPSFKDSLTEERIFIGDIDDRGVTGRVFDNRVGEKRRWRFTMPLAHWATADLYAKWISGKGHCWPFTGASKFSQTGVSNGVAGTFTLSASGGKYGGSISVGSGSLFGVNVGSKMGEPGVSGWSPTLGWTLMAWSERTLAGDGVPADGFYDYLAHGAVAVTRGAAANPVGVTQYRDGVAGSFNMGNFINVLTANMGVTGHRQTGASTAEAKVYDELVLLPFQVDTTWVATIAAFRAARAWSSLPYVYLGGSVINSGTPIEVIGRVKDITYQHARGLPNERVLAVTLEER